MKTSYQRLLTLTAMTLLTANTALCASETDDRIELAFRESYVFKTYLKDDSIKVESKEGAVTLMGTVEQPLHKGLAEETAGNLPGVVSVNNLVALRAEYPVEKSDEWIAMNIMASLFFHRNTNAENTKITVKNGIVTLRGEVANEAQKELTGEYADVLGVREIKNEMTVAKDPKNKERTMKEKIDDASITAQVKMALLSHRSTSALKTSVVTKEGIVTLGGIAQNEAEKDLVTKLVSDIFGVKSIINDMSIIIA